MAASESSGYWSSSSLAATTSHSATNGCLYTKSEPKPISQPTNSRRRTRNYNYNNNNNSSNSNSFVSSTSTSTTGGNGSIIGDTIKRMEPLTIEEYESNYRLGSTDLELIERVFLGSFENNQLRASLWPYLFGLIVHRGRFERVPHTNSMESSSYPTSSRTAADTKHEYVFIEHEANAKRWLELEQLYLSYESQWKAITRDQEERFTLFRERKALIGRDVIRCDRLHPFYAEQPRNLDLLSSLLMTYMMFDFDIGYVQGMSDLAGPILYIFDGDLVKAFWVFVEVMKLVRRNFEHTQTSIHFQLSCLFNLIHITDPKFAKYLEQQESSNCFFAFRAIVCQFKRELMKDDAYYYDKCLQLWDTIWCVERRCVLEANLMAISNDHHQPMGSNCSPRSLSNINQQQQQQQQQNNNNHHNFYHGASWNSIPNYLTSFSNPLSRSPLVNGASNGCAAANKWLTAKDPTQPDTPRHNLTETEIFILALCLVMILRERDTILSNRLDGNDIHLHFIEPKLANDLKGFIQSAINTYRIMKNDLDMRRLTSSAAGARSNGAGGGGRSASREQQKHKDKDNNDDELDESRKLASYLAPLIRKNISSKPPQTPQTVAASSCSSSNVLEEFLLGSPGSLEGYDFLNDFLIIQRKDHRTSDGGDPLAALK